MKKQIKEFQHNVRELCGLCDKEILTDKDRWVALIDYEGKEELKEAFYHRVCLTDLIRGKGKIIAEKFKKNVMGAARNIFSRINQGNTEFKLATEQF